MKDIKINSKWCKGCGICADFCPKNVYDHKRMGVQPVPARIQDCVDCGQCELKCPDFAITLIKE